MNKRAKYITNWIHDYVDEHKLSTLVIGISGGIDSSVVSTLCAETGLSTKVISMPIHQNAEQNNLSGAHGEWLTTKYSNVTHSVINLDSVFEEFAGCFDSEDLLALANSRARLRMTTLYQVAQMNNGLVVGTGNKVEDFGVGFYTKYGDGGVDISPIADCYKTQVWNMGRSLGVLQEIIDAAPTDGLWDDGRTDEDQIGMTYQELERAMMVDNGMPNYYAATTKMLETYRNFRIPNLHKMQPIPVCMVPEEIE